MIREEMQRENDSKPPQPSEDHQIPATPLEDIREPESSDQGGPGLLSKMLRQPGILGVRTISLHNLLDKPPSNSEQAQSHHSVCHALFNF